MLHCANAVEFTAQPQDASGAVGEFVTFSVEAKNAYSYKWYYQNTSSTKWTATTATGFDTNTLTMEVKNTNNGYKFRCTVTGLDGNTYNSEYATLTHAK